MRVGLMKIGEPLPLERSVRPFRCGLLAEELARLGHDVTWWTSTFDHFRRRHLFNNSQTVSVQDNYRLNLVHAPGYERPVSVRRILHHRRVATELRSWLEREPTPHLIVCSLPVVELAVVAVEYVTRRRIPLIVDVRDHWPDIFLKVVPRGARWIGRAIVQPLVAANRRVLREATCILGTSERQLEWGLRHAARARGSSDRVFYHGYPEIAVDEGDRARAREYWRSQGIQPEDFNCCYFGAIGRQCDMEAVIKAAKVFASEGSTNVKFVMCGSGGRLEYYRRRTRGLGNVVLPGWVEREKIAVLMEWSKVGLAPYVAEESYSLPNKPFEYLCGALPILSSIRGELEALLRENGCGITYSFGRSDEIVSAVKRLRNGPVLQKEMARKARFLYEDRFSAERIYSEMAAHVVDVASRAG